MLPIKSRHFNPLTFRFEDREEWNSFYPTGYTPIVQETNENDVGIARYKSYTAIQLNNTNSKTEIYLAKLKHKNDLEIADKNENIELFKNTTQAFIEDVKFN